jgi:uncharacterized protein YbdZ (MbtH family)
MASSDEQDTQPYAVVVNAEEQYSIWPEGREVPRGWRLAGKTGLKSACLAYIGEVWTDMRPQSLREKMTMSAGDQALTPTPIGHETPVPPMPQ